MVVYLAFKEEEKKEEEEEEEKEKEKEKENGKGKGKEKEKCFGVLSGLGVTTPCEAAYVWRAHHSCALFLVFLAEGLTQHKTSHTYVSCTYGYSTKHQYGSEFVFIYYIRVTK